MVKARENDYHPAITWTKKKFGGKLVVIGYKCVFLLKLLQMFFSLKYILSTC